MRKNIKLNLSLCAIFYKLPNTVKICSSCKEWKDLSSFYRCDTHPDGLQYACKDCQKASTRERHAQNPEKRAEQYQNWLSQNAERKRLKRAEYNRANAAKNAAYMVEYRKKNREKYNASMVRQRRENIALRITNNLQCRIWSALNRPTAKGIKAARTMELIGCSLEALRLHLESKFLPGMTWENHGKKGWHIDHERPCASFDLTDPAQQRACFHFTNLQPLWWMDNHKKGSRFTEPR